MRNYSESEIYQALRILSDLEDRRKAAELLALQDAAKVVELMTSFEAQEFLECSSSTVNRLAKKHNWKNYGDGKTHRYAKSDVEPHKQHGKRLRKRGGVNVRGDD